MRNSRMESRTSETTKENRFGETVEVLYQKMGDRWFAFSLIDDSVFVGSVSQSEIDNGENKEGRTKEITN